MPYIRLNLPVVDDLLMKWFEDLAGERLLPNFDEIKRRIDLADGLLPVDVQMEIEDCVAMDPTSKRIASILAGRNRLSLRVVDMDVCAGRCDGCTLRQICERRIGEVKGRYLNIVPALTSSVVQKILKLEV